jgi:hypothetical protein
MLNILKITSKFKTIAIFLLLTYKQCFMQSVWYDYDLSQKYISNSSLK